MGVNGGNLADPESPITYYSYDGGRSIIKVCSEFQEYSASEAYCPWTPHDNPTSSRKS